MGFLFCLSTNDYEVKLNIFLCIHRQLNCVMAKGIKQGSPKPGPWADDIGPLVTGTGEHDPKVEKQLHKGFLLVFLKDIQGGCWKKNPLNTSFVLKV